MIYGSQSTCDLRGFLPACMRVLSWFGPIVGFGAGWLAYRYVNRQSQKSQRFAIHVRERTTTQDADPAVVDLTHVSLTLGRAAAEKVADEIISHVLRIAGSLQGDIVRVVTDEAGMITGSEHVLRVLVGGHRVVAHSFRSSFPLTLVVDAHEWDAILSDQKVLRDVVVTRMMPLMTRLMPCENHEMALCIIRVVKNFLVSEENHEPLFVDVLPLLANPRAASWLLRRAITFIRVLNRERRKNSMMPVSAIAALETRGFMFGAMLAARLGVAFVPLRRPGKYPGRVVIRQQFTKATGKDTLELDATVLGTGEPVVLVDDLLVSGASLFAASKAVAAARAVVSGAFVSLEVKETGGVSPLLRYAPTWPVCAPITLADMKSAPNVEDLLDATSLQHCN